MPSAVIAIIAVAVALIIVIFMANRYFDQGLFAPVSATFAATIDAGTNAEIAKWLFIWAIPGAIIQLLGGKRQLGILFATGLLVGNIINGLTIAAGLIIRLVAVRANKENEQTLNTGRSCYLQLLHRYSGTGRKERLIGVT